jgi:spore maturation protein CgeB
MNVKLFCHSLVSDWNHGNAHFLRGIVRELRRRGHAVDVLEPEGGWSRTNLLRDAGPSAVEEFTRRFPELESRTYSPDFDLRAELADAELVIVHDWNEPGLVARIGERRRAGGEFILLFYDAHHRAATSPEQIGVFDLSGYDAVLAFGSLIRDLYLEHGWARRAYAWHEAADTALFHPLRNGHGPEGDLVWIGNWGDGERTAELHEFLLGPARRLGLRGRVHGVRYPPEARRAVLDAGLRYEGWLPNHRAPEAFSAHRVTVHVPRRAYVRRLPGIPTIRVFEALACGIPLVCAPWEDRERLFRPGEDYLVARDGEEMAAHLRLLLEDRQAAAQLAHNGLDTVRRRHTCAHRVDELEAIVEELR